MDQWDHITVFIRNVWNDYMLEFAQGNAPLLSRVPIAFESTQVGSNSELLNEAISKLLGKGAIKHVEDNRCQASTADFFSFPSGMAAIDRSSTCHV